MNPFASKDNYLLTLANGQPADPMTAETIDFSSVSVAIAKNKTFYCFEVFADNDPFVAFGSLQTVLTNIIQNAQTEISAGNINGFYICNLFYQFAELVNIPPQGKLICSAIITFY